MPRAFADGSRRLRRRDDVLCALCAQQSLHQEMCPHATTAGTFGTNTRAHFCSCAHRDGGRMNALNHSRDCAAFRRREAATYGAAWGRRPSETKCSDLCHKTAGFLHWNSWKLPASSPRTASSPRKESLERSARRSAQPRASAAPG